MKSIRIIAPLIILHLAACKKPPSAPQPDKLTGDKAMLIGTWNWTYTHHRYNWCVGSELNETIEPEEDDYSFIMKEEGIIEFYKNENVLFSHDIFFEHFTPLEGSGFVFSIRLDDYDSKMKYVCRVHPFVLTDPNPPSNKKKYFTTPVSYAITVL